MNPKQNLPPSYSQTGKPGSITTVPPKNPGDLAPAFEISPASLTDLVNQLSPAEINQLVGRPIIERDGGYYAPDEFIAISRDDWFGRLVPGNEYTLAGATSTYRMQILKNRPFTDGEGARYFLLYKLLGSAADFINLLNEVSVDVQTGSNTLGILQIRPNSDGSGAEDPNPEGIRPNSDGSGASGNAIGVTRFLIRPGQLPAYLEAKLRLITPAFPQQPEAAGGFTANQAVTSQNLTPTDTAITVAVLDSGIYTAVGQPSGCMGLFLTVWQWLMGLLGSGTTPVSTGHDFVDDDDVPQDEHTSLHGTRISTIIRQRCPNAAILPVRIGNARGVCSLYDVLCGLEYARISKATIINASWVFLADNDQVKTTDVAGNPVVLRPYSLLQWMISELNKANKWVVAAAGNRKTGQITPLLGSPGVPFTYPACYSTIVAALDSPKLITVSTIKSDRTVVGENRSEKIVDVGVVADDDLKFRVPGFSAAHAGSSYATPHITGLLADYLRTHSPAQAKAIVLQAIAPNTLPALSNDSIKDKRYVTT